MAGEIRTGVVITADAKGFDEALQKILKVNESSLQGMKEQAKSYQESQTKVQGLEGQISKLAKTQAMLFETMAGMKDKGSNVYKAMAVSLKLAQEESSGLEGAVKNLEKAYQAEAKAVQDLNRANEQLQKTEEKRRQSAEDAAKREDDRKQQTEQRSKGAFLQGLTQGAVPGMPPLFLERGPGMRRQMLGQMIGGAAAAPFRMAGQFAGAAVQAPFQGAQGLAQMASALPGGGIIGGMMGTAVGYAGRAMEWRRQQMEAQPFLGGGVGMMQAQGAAGTRYQAEVSRSRKQNAAIYSDAEFQKMIPGMRQRFNAKNPEAAESAARASPGGGGYATRIPRGYEKYAWAQKARKSIDEKEFTQFTAQQQGNWQAMGAADNRASEQQAKESRQRAIAAARRKANEPIYAATREGVQYGMVKDQALQAMTGIVQGGGGRAPEMMKQGMLRAGFAAKSLYGVGPETSGAFLQAGRRGGLVGGPGKADQMMTRAIADGLSLGLEGSELIDYMQSMAEGIKQWETTGIPIAPDAIKGMAETFSKAGIAGTRAAQMARGVGQFVQGMEGRGGPSTGVDLLTLQAFGFTGKGGAAEYEKTIIKMEAAGQQMKDQGVGGAMSGPMGEVMKRIRGMPGGDSSVGRIMLRRIMREQMGVNMNQEEMVLLDKQFSGEELTPEEQTKVDLETARRNAGAIEAGAVRTPKGLEKAAKSAVPPELRTQAAIQNKQIAAGEQMIGLVNTMDMAAATLVKSFANLTGDAGPVVNLTKKFGDLAGIIEKLSGNKGASFMDYVEGIRMGLSR